MQILEITWETRTNIILFKSSSHVTSFFSTKLSQNHSRTFWKTKPILNGCKYNTMSKSSNHCKCHLFFSTKLSQNPSRTCYWSCLLQEYLNKRTTRLAWPKLTNLRLSHDLHDQIPTYIGILLCGKSRGSVSIVSCQSWSKSCSLGPSLPHALARPRSLKLRPTLVKMEYLERKVRTSFAGAGS